ncbi:hypothetical protein VTJ49DRAFT_7265 [Mycothermus thermophilus]|uniref:Succinate dehydrogenase assembly factor 3 n=1 Tax=Humicola insolens TaxID=85995 RepID=A0ABR3VIR9_HUMIN
MMRPSARLLASATQTVRNGMPGPMNLLPPIYLYRRLLRAHRKHLPPEMRLLGDEYVKAEFRAHRNVENPVHLIGFLTEWQLYAQKIEGDSWKGEKLDQGKIDKMSGKFLLFLLRLSLSRTGLGDEQLGQLYELYQAIQKRGTEGDSSES